MLNTIINLLIIFSLNIFGTCLGTLKTTFLTQKATKLVYLTTFIDAIIAIYALKLLTNSSGYGFILAFAGGKIFGIYIANMIEKKLALGLLEISVNKHPIPGKALADILRCQGYSVTTTIGYGIEGNKRLILTTILPRKQFPNFYGTLVQDGKVNMSVKSITKTYGKVGDINLIAN